MDEFRILICDDNNFHVETIISYIRRSKPEYNYKLITGTNPADIISKLREGKIDAAFLDIEMGEISGIDLGKEIRELYKDCIIVFITGYKNYAFDAYQLRAIDYIMKPIVEEKFNQAMEEVIQLYKNIQDGIGRNYIAIETQDTVVKIRYEDIYYFEKIQRKIKVSTLKRTYEFSGSLKEIKDYTENDDRFVYCHQGFLVNINKITEIRKDTLVLGNLKREVPVSRRFKNSLTESFENVLFKSKRGC